MLSDIAVTAVFAALNTFLIYLLALNVSRLRLKHQVSLGDGGIRPLQKAIRAHGNAVEHVPLFLLLMLLYELQAGASAFLCVIGLIYLASRIVFSLAMIGMVPFVLRQVSAGVSYLAPLIIATALVIGVLK